MTSHLSGVRGLYPLLAAVLVLASLTYYEARRARLEIIPAVDEPIALDPIEARNTLMDSSQVTLKKCWESPECGTVCVETTCGIAYDGTPIPGETGQACVARHQAKVAELMRLCPEED